MLSAPSLPRRTWVLLAALGLALVVGGLSLTRRPAATPAATFDHRRSWFLYKGQLILVSNKEGSSLIQFIAERPSAAEYRWRFRSAGTGHEASGSGRVFEAYSEERTGPSEIKVKDVGSHLAVTAGPFILEWSSGGTNLQYLYIDPSVLSARIVTGEFESFPLGPAV